MKIFLNGSILSKDQAVISVFDHGFLYGFGLFETMRAYNGSIFLLQEHYERLRQSADYYQIQMNKTLEQLQHDIYETLEANRLQNAYIRVTLSAGDQELGLWGQEHDHPNWIIMVRPMGSLPTVKSLVTLDVLRSTAEGKLRTKSLSFANSMLAKKELVRRGQVDKEGLFLNSDGYVVEGTVSNLFFIRDGHVYTPDESTGLLPGVTRDFLIRLCKEMGLGLSTGLYRIEDVLSADEAFICNSIQEIVPVNQINETVFSNVPGPITKQLQVRYGAEIQRLEGGK